MASNTENKKFNPFPGLRPFAPEESDLFFGREGESKEVLDKLLKNRFVTVIGASGSGKSSLIYCGVLPKIRNLSEDESSVWRIITFRPGSNPFGNLAEAIYDDIISAGNKEIDKEEIMAGLHDDSEDITSTVTKYVAQPGEKVLFVVDQFEELFRYSTLIRKETDIHPSAKFIDFLVEAVSQPSGNVFTIVTMRSDFIGECAHYQGLTQLINNSNYLVPHMGTENYKSAIEGPVEYAGAKIDKDLIDILIVDIGERTDQLPVLQHAMMRTWTHWQELDEPDRPIGKTDYESVGTMSNAMSLHANEAYEELDARGKEICEIMFKTITEKGADNKGLRHPSGVVTVKSIAGCSSEELFEVIEKFRVPSRSFITPRQNIPLTDESIIDLSHESLMRLWDRLREWVDDEAASVQMYLRLSEASALYQKGKTSLWRPPDLQLAINWRDKHKPTLAWAERYDPAFERAMVYLRTSEKEYLEEEENKIRLQKKQMKRTRIVAMILGIAAIISVAFMLFAFVQKIAADRQTILAEERRVEAERQTAIADSASIVATEQRIIADSNAVEAQLNAAEAIRQQQEADVQRSLAEINAERALIQQGIAEEQSDSAQRASMRADQNAEMANEQRVEALRLRMLSLGKSMSVKSLQVEGQQDLQTLIAYQAYLFNKNNQGLDNDADIYAGLYNVVTHYGSRYYKSFTGHDGEITSIAYVPGEREFYTSGADGNVIKWSLDEGEQTLQIIYSGNEIIEVLAVSPDASWLACGSDNSSIKMIPLKGNSEAYEMSGHSGKIKSLVFSYDGNYLYSASLDGKVLKWDLAARTNNDVSGESMYITSIDVSSNGNYLAGINNEGNVIVWNPEDNSDNFRVETTRRDIRAIRFSPDNNMLAIGDVNGNVELWDINKRIRISEVKAHSAQINDIRFNPVLDQMATASNDKSLKIFNTSDPSDLTEPPITFTDNEGFVLVIEFSDDGQLILSGTYEGSDNLVSRPSHVDYLVENICSLVTRNMTQEEWNTYVARDIPLEQTCPDKSYSIKVNAINQ
jgi:WD40 repeat protein